MKSEQTICNDFACYPEMELVYDPVTQTCGCYWIPGLKPPYKTDDLPNILDPASEARSDPTVVAKIYRPSSIAIPPISPCATIRCKVGFVPVANTTDNTCKCVPNICATKLICISEKQPVFNHKTSTCECEWLPDFRPLVSERDHITELIQIPDPRPICLAKCTVGYHTVQYPNGGCGCVKDAEPQPCGIKCLPLYNLVTDLDTGKCRCEPGPDYTPCNPKCNDGYHWEDAPNERAGRCVRNAAPVPCPIRCTSASVLFFNPQTGVCSCVGKKQNCIENTQFLEGPSIWNSTTETCTCVDESKKKEEICLLATSCIVGSQPVWNDIKKICTCEPNPTGPEFICHAATTCIIGSVPVWDAKSQTCHCVKLQS